MAQLNYLIMDLLRIMTPEEVGDITTKHNGGKFLSLTDLVNERVQKNIYRNFSKPVEDIEENQTAKILPFKLNESVPVDEEEESVESPIIDEGNLKKSLTTLAENMSKSQKNKSEKAEHAENENMSSFILIEKARLKKSQQILKQKEILELYNKNSNVDVEQIKGQGSDISEARESGVLVNKKHY